MKGLGRWRLRALAMGLAVASSGAAPMLAQAPSGSTFSEVIDVRVINLEVVVTDGDGVRVLGLGPQAFHLTVDGEEVPIEYFTEVVGGEAVAQEDAAAIGTVPALAPGEPVGTSYLLFIDDFFSLAIDRDRVLRRMEDQLSLLGPGDRMAVVAFDGRELEMLSSWSQSPEALRRALRAARERPSYGLRRRAEQRSFEATRTPDGFGIVSSLETQLDLQEEQRAEEVSGQVRRVVLSVAAALRSFANPPGRKVLVLLSGGWPHNPEQWVAGSFTRPVLVSGSQSGERLYEALVETANLLSYTVYPVDLPGLRHSGIAAEDPAVFDADARRRLDRERELDEETAMRIVAQRTGGRALLNGTNAEALGRVMDDTRSYYWLGFTPRWKGDDSSHAVRIAMRDKKLRVRSRQSYSDLSRSTEVSMMVESSLLFGDPPSDAPPLAVTIGRARKSGFRKVTVALALEVPLEGLTFLPHRDGWAAEAELRVAVLDESGATSDVPVIPLRLDLENPPEPGARASFRTDLQLRKREHRMVVSVYDKASGKILTTRLTVDPR